MNAWPALRRPASRNARPGVALLLTLLVVGLLSVSVLSFIRLTSLETKVADNAYTFTQAEILARSGLKGAMTILAMDDNDFDALTDPWANFSRYAALASGLFEEGGFTGNIEDLSGRLNINSLIDRNGLVDANRLARFERLFNLLEFDPETIPAILDWLDADDNPRLGGAENQYYLALAKPYPCANGDLNTLGRILLIKGLGPAAFYGTKDRPGLANVVTVHSDGAVNINTAGETVLMSLDDDLTPGMAREIISHRALKPFERLEDLKLISSLTPEVLARIVGGLAVVSSHFCIRVEGRFRQAKVPLTAIVERSRSGVKLIYYRAG